MKLLWKFEAPRRIIDSIFPFNLFTFIREFIMDFLIVHLALPGYFLCAFFITVNESNFEYCFVKTAVAKDIYIILMLTNELNVN